MKKLWLPIVALGLVMASCATEVKTDDKKEDKKEVAKDADKKEVEDEVKNQVGAVYTADASASVINFVGSKVGEDDDHAGTVKISEGEFTVKGTAVVGGKFTVDMTSADAGIGGLNEHLAKEDMFNMEKFPTATFAIVEGGEEEIKGTLSTIGAELPVTLKVTSAEDGKWTATGSVDYAGTDASTLQHEEGAEKYINSVIALEITLVGSKK